MQQSVNLLLARLHHIASFKHPKSKFSWQSKSMTLDPLHGATCMYYQHYFSNTVTLKCNIHLCLAPQTNLWRDIHLQTLIYYSWSRHISCSASVSPSPRYTTYMYYWNSNYNKVIIYSVLPRKWIRRRGGVAWSLHQRI